jgi:hypothetical protein
MAPYSEDYEDYYPYSENVEYDLEDHYESYLENVEYDLEDHHESYLEDDESYLEADGFFRMDADVQDAAIRNYSESDLEDDDEFFTMDEGDGSYLEKNWFFYDRRI